MTVDQLIDWGLRVVMVFIAIFTVVWGRTQKQTDALVEEKAVALRQLLEHDREALKSLTEAKCTALETRARALDRLFESQLALRDQRMGTMEKQLEDAAERASTAASKLTGKMGEVEHRLTVIETRLEAS